MKISKLTMTSAMALALAACGGSSDSADPDTIVSSGILEIELPTDPSAYGTEVETLIGQVTTANETGSLIDPANSAVYDGTWGAEVNDYVGGDGALIGGDAQITVNLDSTSATATFGVEFAEENDGGNMTSLTVVGDIFEDSGGLTIASGLLSGGLEGDFLVEGEETYSFTGALDGAFADVDGTNTAFGQFDGTLTNTTEGSPDEGLTDDVGGAFHATESP